ncbi:unnamed protein product [Trichogramma brassicae]|uniref:Uncharacterized protein n=1 Tax=Trichogramma brassicae TaxID=86971 RepID=A0A6H5I0Y0_9HYME|nr:unnamed protein product [Trichogramma brassicae]
METTIHSRGAATLASSRPTRDTMCVVATRIRYIIISRGLSQRSSCCELDTLPQPAAAASCLQQLNPFASPARISPINVTMIEDSHFQYRFEFFNRTDTALTLIHNPLIGAVKIQCYTHLECTSTARTLQIIRTTFQVQLHCPRNLNFERRLQPLHRRVASREPCVQPVVVLARITTTPYKAVVFSEVSNAATREMREFEKFGVYSKYILTENHKKKDLLFFYRALFVCFFCFLILFFFFLFFSCRPKTISRVSTNFPGTYHIHIQQPYTSAKPVQNECRRTRESNRFQLLHRPALTIFIIGRRRIYKPSRALDSPIHIQDSFGRFRLVLEKICKTPERNTISVSRRARASQLQLANVKHEERAWQYKYKQQRQQQQQHVVSPPRRRHAAAAAAALIVVLNIFNTCLARTSFMTSAVAAAVYTTNSSEFIIRRRNGVAGARRFQSFFAPPIRHRGKGELRAFDIAVTSATRAHEMV